VVATTIRVRSPHAETTLPHLDTKAGTGPSGSGKNLPGEAGLLPDRAQGLTREAGNPGLQKKQKKEDRKRLKTLVFNRICLGDPFPQFVFICNDLFCFLKSVH